nr:DUF2007 domain-containing protein [Thiocapsa sp.]
MYQARDRIEAQLLRDFLDRHLVRAVVLGEHLSGAAGGLPADIYPTVWILEDDDLERGRDLLARFQADCARRGSASTWTCSGCGERVEDDFDRCWNCGRERAEPAAGN